MTATLTPPTHRQPAPDDRLADGRAADEPWSWTCWQD